MSDDRLRKIEKAIIDICVYLHTELSSMVIYIQSHQDNESLMELTSILKLDSFSALDHITEVSKDLISKVRDFRMMEEYDSLQSHEQYEKALQKLESEVRNHIKIEQQLKLYIENTQQKLEESEKARETLSATNKNIMEKLRTSRNSGAGKDDLIFKSFETQAISTKELRNQEKGEDMNKIIQELATLRYTSKKDTQRIAELENNKSKLESDHFKFKSQTADKSKEYDKLYKKYDELKRKLSKSKENHPDSSACITDFYKRKYHEKCEEITQLEKKFRILREKPNTPNETLRRNPSTKSIRDSSVGKSPNYTARKDIPVHPLKSDRSENGFLSTTRSIKPIHERSTSVEKLSRSRPSSSNLSSYMLNTSRR